MTHQEPKNKDLSIVIVNWNGGEGVIRCLDSVFRFTEGLDFEVVVVDNGSSDGSVEQIESEFSQVEVIRNGENLGFARGNNIGIRASSGRCVLLLNDDTEFLENSAKLLYDFLNASEQRGACGARLVYPGGTPQWSYGCAPSFGRMLWITFSGMLHIPWGRKVGAIIPTGEEEAGPVEYIVGADLMIKRRVLDRVGLLDEGFFAYFEETDLCTRMREAGCEVWYMPNTAIVHHIGETFTRDKAKIYYTSMFRYLDKHFGYYRRVKYYLMAKHAIRAAFSLGAKKRKLEKERYSALASAGLEYSIAGCSSAEGH